MRRKEPTKAPSDRGPSTSKPVVLVAEDDAVNRELIRKQLARLGRDCEVACDGNEALEMWRSKAYGLLLLDLQMPIMDGFLLTAAIRSAEREKARRLPIVAITANAVPRERARCLAAGMNDYLTKPIKLAQMKVVLEKWLEGDDAEQGHATQSVTPVVGEEPVHSRYKTPCVVDEKALRELFGDEPETRNEIFREFLNAAGANVEEIGKAWQQHSFAEIARAAHKLQSSARSVGAHRLADTSRALEMAAKVDDDATVARLVADLYRLMQEVTAYFDGLEGEGRRDIEGMM